MGLVDLQGRPLSSQSSNAMRNGAMVEGFSLPGGTVVSRRASMALHQRIQNDTTLRERIEQADKDQLAMRRRAWLANGKRGPEPKLEESLHLAMVRRGNKEMTPAVQAAIERNLDFGETIQRKRNENENITEGKAAYERLAS